MHHLITVREALKNIRITIYLDPLLTRTDPETNTLFRAAHVEQ